MWQRNRGPKLTADDGISLVDSALNQLGQSPLADNSSFESQPSPEWMAEYHHELSDRSVFSIEIYPDGIVVGALFPEVFEAGPKQIRDERDETVGQLCRVLSSRIEILERRPGKSYELRFLDDEDQPFFRHRYSGRYPPLGNLRLDPVVQTTATAEAISDPVHPE